jgi:hypothetical protein
VSANADLRHFGVILSLLTKSVQLQRPFGAGADPGIEPHLGKVGRVEAWTGGTGVAVELTGGELLEVDYRYCSVFGVLLGSN